MSDALKRHVPESIATAASAAHVDHSLIARQMAEHLGKMALSTAIDRHALASLFDDGAARCFWGRVCEELADLAIPVEPSRQ